MLGKAALSLLTGSTFGATLMYLFDPDQGDKHRKTLKRTAATTYDTARQSAQPVVADVRSRLSHHLAAASRAIAPHDDTLLYTHPHLTPTQSYTALSLTRHARELPVDTRDTYARARDLYYNALIDLDLARHPRPTPKPKPLIKKVYVKRPTPDYLTLSLVAAGCCAAGAAAMFILDPTAGRRRRALVRDKTYRTTHRATQAVGDTLTRTTHHIRGRAQGQLARAKSSFRHDASSDAQLTARIRTQLGRVLTYPHSIQVTANNGTITLAGTIPSSEFDPLMKTVYAIPGVREVINRTDLLSSPTFNS